MLSNSNLSNLQLRLLSALAYLPLLFIIFLIGDVWFILAAAFVAYIGVYELVSLLHKAGWQPLIPQGAIAGACLIASLQFESLNALFIWVASACSIAFLSFMNRQSLRAVGDGTITFISIFIICLPLTCLVLLRLETNGLQWAAVALLATFANDTGAYSFGKIFGTHKLAPKISPNKTWEGAIAGLCSAIICTIVLTHILNSIPDTIVISLLLGSAIGVFAQIGDLLESAVKRIANEKDSGNIIPGHGGILDRLDSLIFVFPVVYAASIYWPGA